VTGMSSLDDLERRVAAVETTLASELPVVRAEAAAARALAAGADRDVAEYRSELRSHTQMLNALRETQVEHYIEHKADAAELKAGVGELKSSVGELKAGLAQIVRMLEGLGGARS
jgi:X-X-X-Leu-X-X-Gly heptad repeat protein